MTNKKKNGHSECHIQTRARCCPKVFFDLVCDQFPVQRRSFPGLYTNWKQLDTSLSSVAFMHQLKGIRSAEMLSGARQKSKQVPSLFPGNNGEHLQFDEESIASTYHWFRTTANKCESRWAGWVKRWQKKLKQTQCLKQKKWSKRLCHCLCCSNSDQLFGEHGARQQIRRRLAGKPETVAVSEIRHGLVPIQGGWKHDRLHLQPQQNPWAKPGEHVLPFCPLHPSVPHAPP